jgi:hypothetical protein
LQAPVVAIQRFFPSGTGKLRMAYMKGVDHEK